MKSKTTFEPLATFHDGIFQSWFYTAAEFARHLLTYDGRRYEVREYHHLTGDYRLWVSRRGEPMRPLGYFGATEDEVLKSFYKPKDADDYQRILGDNTTVEHFSQVQEFAVDPDLPPETQEQYRIALDKFKGNPND